MGRGALKKTVGCRGGREGALALRAALALGDLQGGRWGALLAKESETLTTSHAADGATNANQPLPPFAPSAIELVTVLTRHDNSTELYVCGCAVPVVAGEKTPWRKAAG